MLAQVNGVPGSVDTVGGNSTFPILTVTPPALAAGEWPVTVSVAGFGYAAPMLETQKLSTRCVCPGIRSGVGRGLAWAAQALLLLWLL